MIINGSEKVAVEWTFESLLVIAQANNVVSLNPTQAKALLTIIEEGLKTHLRYDSSVIRIEAE